MNKNKEIKKVALSDFMPNFILHLFYLMLKKDMVKKLRKKNGEQLTDHVMETFGVPTNLMDKHYK